jgi:hypothetical protein
MQGWITTLPVMSPLQDAQNRGKTRKRMGDLTETSTGSIPWGNLAAICEPTV